MRLFDSHRGRRNVLDADGNYCGGVISPGINLAFEALYLGAAKLPRIEIRREEVREIPPEGLVLVATGPLTSVTSAPSAASAAAMAWPCLPDEWLEM